MHFSLKNLWICTNYNKIDPLISLKRKIVYLSHMEDYCYLQMNTCMKREEKMKVQKKLTSKIMQFESEIIEISLINTKLTHVHVENIYYVNPN